MQGAWVVIEEARLKAILKTDGIIGQFYNVYNLFLQHMLYVNNRIPPYALRNEKQ